MYEDLLSLLTILDIAVSHFGEGLPVFDKGLYC